MAENITNVKLLNVPLDNEYKHTYYFKDRTTQLNYFNNVGGKSFSDFSYQRKDSKLRVNLSLDQAMKYNYVSYQNREYNSKTFYAFIIDYEWKRDDVTELTLETDVIQSWMFDYDIKPSFIEREHAIRDSIGDNTIPENLEVGEYITSHPHKEIMEMYSLKIVVGVTKDVGSTSGYGGVYNGIYSGIIYHAFPNTIEGVKQVNDFIKSYVGSLDAIKCIFLAPDFMAHTLSDSGQSGVGIMTRVENNVNVAQISVNFGSVGEMTNLNGDGLEYDIKNNKLKTFPYQYMLLTNNSGGSAIYKYENFKGNNIDFYLNGALTPGCSIKIVPKDYKGDSYHYEEGLVGGKYPICNWSSDEYTNWLTQNGVNIAMNLTTGGLQIVGGAVAMATTGGAGAVLGGSSIVGGIQTIANQLAQIHQMSFTPPQVNGNINSGDVNTSHRKNTFTAYYMCIKKEYAKVIDEYFSAYGYKTNRIKIPESNHRERWWFTKTVDINIIGYDVPILDLDKIKACYNNGITFWRADSDTNFKDYNQTNYII